MSTDIDTKLQGLIDGSVLEEVAEERRRQDARWGEQNHPDLSPMLWGFDQYRVAEEMGVPSADLAKQRVDRGAERHILGYADIALEEFAEAIEAAALSDTTALRKELVQTAAVLVAWVGCIDRRQKRVPVEAVPTSAQPPATEPPPDSVPRYLSLVTKVGADGVAVTTAVPLATPDAKLDPVGLGEAVVDALVGAGASYWRGRDEALEEAACLIESKVGTPVGYGLKVVSSTEVAAELRARKVGA